MRLTLSFLSSILCLRIIFLISRAVDITPIIKSSSLSFFYKAVDISLLGMDSPISLGLFLRSYWCVWDYFLTSVVDEIIFLSLSCPAKKSEGCFLLEIFILLAGEGADEWNCKSYNLDKGIRSIAFIIKLIILIIG